jgi:arabinose-5-phosphate isomerase
MNLLEEAKRVLEVEANAILKLRDGLNGDFEKAVALLKECDGKVVFSGMGKSGHIARKVSSTMSSTGTPSIFVHPAEASHGDMGIISENDIVVMISNGGNSVELADMIAYVKRKNITLIAFTANPDSQLGQNADIILDISVEEEACPMGLAPTTSTTVTLALGDALAIGLLVARGFAKEDYAEFHPGGSLGRRLLTKVQDVMHKGTSLPLVKPDTPMKEVISKMTEKDVRGVAGVVGESGELIGVITDGDIRRRLEKSDAALVEPAKDLMSNSPKTISGKELAQKALFMMEQFQIQTLFVVDEKDKKLVPIGLLHLQDLLKAKVR